MAANNDAESAIYNRLTTAPTFKPSGVKLFAPDWTLEPGDVVTVQSDGVNYPVPIYSMNLEWRNATKVDIQSSGSQKREPLSPLRRMEYRSGRRGYGAVQQAEEMQKQYEHFVEDTDAYRLEIYKINGVEFDPETGKVVYELVYQTDPVTGEPIIDPVTGEKVPVIDPATGEPMIKTDNAGNPIPVYNEESDGSIASQVIRSAQQISQKVTQQDVNRSLTGYLQTTAWESRMGNYLEENKDGVMVMKGIAEVVTMINEQKEGVVLVNGDKVKLNSGSGGSTFTLDDKIVIDTDGYTKINGVLMVSGTGTNAKHVTINNGKITVYGGLDIASNQSLKFIGTQDGEYYDFDASDAKKLETLISTGIVNARISGNILTLTKSNGDVVNFSKATSVSGEWGSRATPESQLVPNGTLYVKATQTNYDETEEKDVTTVVGSMDIHLHNAGHWGSASTQGENINIYYYRVTASQGSSAAQSETGLSFNVDATGRYRQGTADVVLKNYGSGKYGDWIDDPNDDHAYSYEISTDGRLNSSTGAANEYVRYITPTEAIERGKTLVGIDTITLGTITANSSARTATVSATVTLDNGVTKTSDVDVSTIYQAGLDGGPEITSAPFVVKLVDNNNVFIKNRQKTVNVSAIYQKGVDDAAPPVTVYFIYRETGVLTNAYSAAKTLPSKSDIIGQLYPNTIINFIRYYTATDGILSVQYVECEYYGMTFYVMAQNVHTGTTPDSPTNYPNMTGWYSGQAVTYDYTGVVSFDTGNYVNIYSSQSTSSSSVTTVPNEASVQCMHNPNGYSGEWMPVKYGNYTGYMEAKYIYGTQAWNDAHPSVPVLQAIDIQWIVHSTSSYTESVTMLVDTTKDSATTKTCDYVPASAYNAITTDSSADVSQYLEYVYRYAYLSYVQTDGMPDQITAKIRLKLTYSGTDTPTYLNLELNSVGQIVYRYTSTVYAETGSTVRMRSGPGTSYSTVTNVPIGSTIYCFENPNGYPKQNEWMRVKYGQHEGYMMSKFIVGTGAYEEEFGGGGDDPNDIATVQITGVAHQAQYFNGRFSITIQPSYPNENGTYANSATSSVPTNYSTFGNNADDTAGMGAYFSTVWSSYYATNNTQSEMGPSDTECEHKMVVRVTLKNGDSYTRLITFKSKYR